MSLEWNKIFAAVLVAGITAQVAGFASDKIFHKEALEENAYEIEVAEMPGASMEATGPTGPEPILALLADADVTKGEKLSKACAACHSFDQGGPNKVGPNLYGIVNSHYAHLDNFAYSDAIKAAGEAGATWTYQNLNAFLWKPKEHIPGTKMNYIGMKKASDRAAIIAWLRTVSNSPAALPDASAIAAEAPEEATESEETQAQDAMEDTATPSEE